MKKTVFIPIILTPLLIGLVGCDSGAIPPVDADFDGLRNDIDPDPNNNEYKFHINNADDTPFTKQDKFVMDYREFLRDDLTTKYNTKLAKLGSLLLNESYFTRIVIENNVYTAESSNISKLLTQIGCTDIVYKDFTKDTFAHDKNDIVNMKIGHHVVVDGDKKLNVTFAEIMGYPTDLGWESNFHVGADTQDYIDTTGEHEEWLEKKNHKGFDVSAKRAFDYIKTYLNEHKVANVDDLVFVTGHSRGAATSSLIGKKLKDNNIKSLVYAFNTPSHIADTGEDVCKSYDNIWQIINEEDFVSKIPLASWNNFTHLGHIMKYKMSENASKYKDYFVDRSYPAIDPKLNDQLCNGLEKLIANRESIYKWREPSTEYKEVLLHTKKVPFDTEEDALNEIEDYYDEFNDPEAAKKMIEMTVAPYSLNPRKFQINYRTKPQIIISLIGDVFLDGEASIINIANVISAYLPFLGRYLKEIAPELKYLFDNMPDSFNQIGMTHEQNITFVSSTLF